jgi:hypothetical protein
VLIQAVVGYTPKFRQIDRALIRRLEVGCFDKIRRKAKNRRTERYALGTRRPLIEET